MDVSGATQPTKSEWESHSLECRERIENAILSDAAGVPWTPRSGRVDESPSELMVEQLVMVRLMRVEDDGFSVLSNLVRCKISS